MTSSTPQRQNKPSRMRASKILGTLSEVDARDFLCDLANLKEGDLKGLADLRKTFPEMFHPHTSDEVVFTCATELRKAWDAPDQRRRDWYSFRLRLMHWQRGAKFKIFPTTPGVDLMAAVNDWLSGPPPEVTPFEAALYYFQVKVADKAKRCGSEDCLRPYFIAAKRWQRFCSENCAGPAIREKKRRWWSENRGKGAL